MTWRNWWRIKFFFLYFIILKISSAVFTTAIAFEDFKSSNIHLAWIAGFALCNVLLFLYSETPINILIHVAFCLIYFLLNYAVIATVIYLRTKKFEFLIDKYFGWADVWVCLSIGICLEPAKMIYFFTAAFLVTLAIHKLFFKKNNSVPLAGYLVLLFLAFQVFIS